MRLLVSVRNAGEARAAVMGGAEIIDAQEPLAGPIGQVAPATLAAIHGALPAGLRLSAALGDATAVDDVARAVGRVSVPVSYVKLGFRGVLEVPRLAALLGVAVRRAAELPGRPAVIAVAYADHAKVGAPPPGLFPRLLAETGADGLLVDTYAKDGTTLFDHQGVEQLAALARALSPGELTFALGGSLGMADLRAAGEAGADILGVRGAVCSGGRSGRVEEGLVRQLAEAVRSARARA